MTYLIVSQDELYHHGIKGQKWGVRRYQNPDGTLTAAGKARYHTESLQTSGNENSLLRRYGSGDFGLINYNRYQNKQEKASFDRARKAESRGNHGMADKHLESARTFQKQNVARDRYLADTSTGKLVAQRLLLGGVGSGVYQNARARGETRVQAWMQAGLSRTVLPLGLALDQELAKRMKY